MTEKQFESLQKEIKKVDIILKKLGVPDSILERRVKCFGNGGHIVIPKEHLNKTVKIIVS